MRDSNLDIKVSVLASKARSSWLIIMGQKLLERKKKQLPYCENIEGIQRNLNPYRACQKCFRHWVLRWHYLKNCHVVLLNKTTWAQQFFRKSLSQSAPASRNATCPGQKSLQIFKKRVEICARLWEVHNDSRKNRHWFLSLKEQRDHPKFYEWQMQKSSTVMLCECSKPNGMSDWQMCTVAVTWRHILGNYNKSMVIRWSPILHVLQQCGLLDMELMCLAWPVCLSAVQICHLYWKCMAHSEKEKWAMAKSGIMSG